MKKGAKIAIIVATVVVIILGILISSIFTTATRTAYLMIDEGSVDVDVGRGWQSAVDMMELSLNDKVKTNSGKATVVFYDSIIVNLDENTEITISELSNEKVSLEQKTGSTWHKFIKLLGIGEYKVSTPRAVATIRGTEVGIDVGTDGDSVTLGEGDVVVEFDGKRESLDPLQRMFIGGDGRFSLFDITTRERQRVVTGMRKSLETMKIIRRVEIEHHRRVVNTVMASYAAEQTVDEYLEDIDAGEIDDNVMVEKSPVKVPALKKVKTINDEVKKSEWLIQQIEEGRSGEEIKRGVRDRDYLPAE